MPVESRDAGGAWARGRGVLALNSTNKAIKRTKTHRIQEATTYIPNQPPRSAHNPHPKKRCTHGRLRSLLCSLSGSAWFCTWLLRWIVRPSDCTKDASSPTTMPAGMEIAGLSASCRPKARVFRDDEDGGMGCGIELDSVHSLWCEQTSVWYASGARGRVAMTTRGYGRRARFSPTVCVPSSLAGDGVDDITKLVRVQSGIMMVGVR